MSGVHSAETSKSKQRLGEAKEELHLTPAELAFISQNTFDECAAVKVNFLDSK